MPKYLLSLLLTLRIMALSSQQSFTLEQSIGYALQNNLELKSKAVAERDANAQIREFKAIGIPKVNAFVNYQYFMAVPAQPVQDFISPSIYNVLFDENVIPRRELGPPETFKFTLFQPHQLVGGIEASSMIFDGAYLYGVKASKLYRELVAAEKAVTERDVRVNITKAYLAALIAQENMTMLQKNQDNLKNALREVKAMYENGFAEKLDVDRMQLSSDNLDIEVIKMQQLITMSKNILKFHMNFPMTENIILSDKIDILTSTLNAVNDDISENTGVAGRPEYRVIEKGQDLNEIDLKRIKAGYLPTARAFVNAQASLFRRNLFNNDETGWIPQSAVGLALNIPIYDGGDKNAKIQRIRLNMEKVAIEKEQFEKSVEMEISNATLTLSNARSFVSARENALNISQSIYDKTLIKFREGVGSSVEVNQAESALYQAQSMYVNAIYDMLSAYTDYLKATGKI